MRAPHGFIDDFVHQAQGFQTVGGNAQGFGSVFGLVASFPEDGGTPLRADHGIHGVLQHQGLVCHADGQRTSRAPFTDHCGDDGHFELRHFKNIAPNRLRLTTLLSINPRKCPGCIHKSEDRQTEFFCCFHQTQGFAVALGLAHAKVAQGALFGVAPFLLANDHARVTIEARQAAHNGKVVGKVAIAVHLQKISEDFPYIVQRVRALGMAGDFRHLPRRQIAVDVFGELLAFFAQLLNFGRNIDGAFGLHVAQLFDFGLQLSNGLFEVQKVFFRQDSFSLRQQRLGPCAQPRRQILRSAQRLQGHQ